MTVRIAGTKTFGEDRDKRIPSAYRAILCIHLLIFTTFISDSTSNSFLISVSMCAPCASIYGESRGGLSRVQRTVNSRLEIELCMLPLDLSN